MSTPPTLAEARRLAECLDNFRTLSLLGAGSEREERADKVAGHFGWYIMFIQFGTGRNIRLDMASEQTRATFAMPALTHRMRRDWPDFDKGEISGEFHGVLREIGRFFRIRIVQECP